MKKILTILMSVAAIFSLSSCGDSGDKLMEDQLDYLNEMSEIIEEVADGSMSSADASEKFAGMKEAGDEFMERKKVLFKDISPEEVKAITEKYSKRSGESMMRYMKALEALRKSGRMTEELRKAVENIQ